MEPWRTLAKMFFQEEVCPSVQPFVYDLSGNLSIISIGHHLFHMFLIWILNLHARLYQRLSKYQEKFPLCHGLQSKLLYISFVINSNCATRYETWLTLCKKFILHKVVKQRIEYKLFKNFTEDRKKTKWTIIFYQFCTLFFMDWYYILFFRSSGKMPPLTLI